MTTRTTARKAAPYAATVAVLVAALAAPQAAKAATDVVFLGGTGTGMQLTQLFGTGGSPTGLTDPFVADRDNLAVPIYDGAPWANPHAGVPLALSTVAAQDDPTVVVGLSKGAQVARATEQLDPNPGTRYVLIGDPDDDHGVSRTFGLSAPKAAPTHDVDIVVAEYDGVGDMPDRPGNLLATANALAGWAFVHPHYGAGGDIDPLTRLDEATVTSTRNPNGTTTTRHLIPTRNLPLTQPLRDTERTLTGRTVITDHLDRALRPAIDAGYSRNDKPKADTAPKADRDQDDDKPAQAPKADKADRDSDRDTKADKDAA